MPYHFSNPRGLRSSLPGKGEETRCFSIRLLLASAVWLASFLRAQVTHPQAKGEASFSGLRFEQGSLSWDPCQQMPLQPHGPRLRTAPGGMGFLDLRLAHFPWGSLGGRPLSGVMSPRVSGSVSSWP